jgi:NAD(P)H-hydrate epimerase
MYLVTAEQMRKLEARAMTESGLPSLVLMENAARAVAEAVIRLNREDRPMKRWVILTGKGNNGGDGIAAARHLTEAGYSCEILLATAPEQLGQDAAVQLKAARYHGIAVQVYVPGAVNWHRYEGIIDALLGTGTSGAPREPYASMIREANGSGLPIVAVDIPSGLDADTGSLYEPYIRATHTVTFAYSKLGLAQYPGKDAAGTVTTAPIGIPELLAEEEGIHTFLLDERTLRRRLHIDPALPRRADTHKGTYGHLLIAAGTMRMSGAGLLCASAALRAGCGLVTWALPAAVAGHVVGRVPEVMLTPVAGTEDGGWTLDSAEELAAHFHARDALAVGPGLGRFPNDTAWLRRIWELSSEAKLPLVLDADALNMLADAADFADWSKRPDAAPAILTPHPGEMARLTGLTTAEVQRDRLRIAREYAAKHDVFVVLKGAASIVASPDGTAYVNTTGNPGMATGGSGDVLTGIIGSLLAQGWSAEQAAAFGTWRHGQAGDLAARKRQSMASLIASDMIDQL